MGLLVPNAVEIVTLNNILTPPLTMKLYTNNKTPAAADTAALYTEVGGGGYVSKPLLFANWVITGGAPSTAKYPVQTWIFTGPTTPINIYGYFVIRNSDGLLQWAERFPAANVPFVAEVGSKIVVIPHFEVESAF